MGALAARWLSFFLRCVSFRKEGIQLLPLLNSRWVPDYESQARYHCRIVCIVCRTWNAVHERPHAEHLVDKPIYIHIKRYIYIYRERESEWVSERERERVREREREIKRGRESERERERQRERREWLLPPTWRLNLALNHYVAWPHLTCLIHIGAGAAGHPTVKNEPRVQSAKRRNGGREWQSNLFPIL